MGDNVEHRHAKILCRISYLCWNKAQYLKRTICYGGTFRDVERGISLGCPLSPLMGALYLKPLDDQMAKLDVYYVRYMDDWLVIASSRWKLRKTVKIVNATLSALNVVKHPDKTFIGKSEKGFDFLGYSFTPGSLGVAKATLERAVQKLTQLYEQGADDICAGEYV